MKKINKDKVSLKLTLGLHRLSDEPTDIEMLYEITSHLDDNSLLDDGFTLGDLRPHVHNGIYVNGKMYPLILRLIDAGYVERITEGKAGKRIEIVYKIKNHIWN